MVIVRQLLPHLVKIGPSRFRRWVVDHTPYWRVQKVKGVADMMHGIACQIFEAKKSALAKGEEAVVQQVGEGKDIISKLCTYSSLCRMITAVLIRKSTVQANMVASEEDRLPDSEVLAQISYGIPFLSLLRRQLISSHVGPWSLRLWTLPPAPLHTSSMYWLNILTRKPGLERN